MATVSKMNQPAAPTGTTSKLLPPDKRQADQKRLREQQRGAMVKDVTRREWVPNPNAGPGEPDGHYVTTTGKEIDPKMQEELRQQDFGSATRQLEIEQGRERGREIFEGQLGRVEEQRSPAMAQLLGERKTRMDEGLGSAAFQAAREQRLRGLGGAEQMQQRALAQSQARSGVRGGAAQGQLAELMGSQMRDRQSAEQQMLLADVALKQGMMDKYAAQLGGVEADELARQKYNIGQVGKEKFGELSTGLAEGSMGIAERTGVRQTEAAKAMQQAMAAAGGSGGKK